MRHSAEVRAHGNPCHGTRGCAGCMRYPDHQQEQRLCATVKFVNGSTRRTDAAAAEKMTRSSVLGQLRALKTKENDAQDDSGKALEGGECMFEEALWPSRGTTKEKVPEMRDLSCVRD